MSENIVPNTAPAASEHAVTVTHPTNGPKTVSFPNADGTPVPFSRFMDFIGEEIQENATYRSFDATGNASQISADSLISPGSTVTISLNSKAGA